MYIFARCFISLVVLADSYLEDLKSSNIQDSDEGGARAKGAVEGLVDTEHHPLEETLVESSPRFNIFSGFSSLKFGQS